MISEIISSPSNRWIKAARDVATSQKARNKTGLMFLEGVHLCEAYLNAQNNVRTSAQTSLQTDAHANPEAMLIGQDYFDSAQAGELVQLWQARNGKVVVLLDKLFSEITQVENGPAIAMLVATPDVQVFLRGAKKNADVVFLDGLQDPGNAGTILRSALACGIQTICASPTTVSLWSPKVLRSAMGAHFHLSVTENVTLDAIFGIAKERTASIFVTTGQATKTLFESNLKANAVWVLGNEGQGVDLDTYSLSKARTDTDVKLQFVKIPQQSVESLNVASAAAVCFYEQWRQRQFSPPK
jgi:RNA methyltransferase, TrmH family